MHWQMTSILDRKVYRLSVYGLLYYLLPWISDLNISAADSELFKEMETTAILKLPRLNVLPLKLIPELPPSPPFRCGWVVLRFPLSLITRAQSNRR